MTIRCPDCGKLPTWTDPQNPKHIICEPCDLESLLCDGTDRDQPHADYCDMCGHAYEDHDSDNGIGPCHNGEANGNTC